MPRYQEMQEAQMNAEQKRVFADCKAGPRGAVPPPVHVWLKSPGLADHAHKLGGHVRFGTPFTQKQTEIAILVTARYWTAQFEWVAHVRLGLAAGLTQEQIDAIAERKTPNFTDADDQLVYDFAHSYYQNHRVSDDVYERVVKRWGDQGIVDLAGLIGYYSFVSVTLNVFDVPTPAGTKRLENSARRAQDRPTRAAKDWSGMAATDGIGAFVPGEQFRIEGRASGPLSGLTFAAKDLFDVAGHPTGGGNPDWARANPIPAKHAWAVQTLLDAGATLIGKTITDEVSLGILGENPFEGTPVNPRAPDRVPGGSSAGSASAVAAGVCDTALGTDTGGSVRVPSSFCGLYGIRPTHGRLDVTGMMSQAPTSDTTGWFARDAETFAKVSAVLLGEAIPDTRPTRLLIATDAFAIADPETAAALQPMVEHLGKLIGNVAEVTMAPPGLATWAKAQRTLQPYEAWQTFAPWIDKYNPRFQFTVARNLVTAATIPAGDRNWAALVRQEARGRLRQLLPPGTILCLPTTPFPAPLRGLPVSVLEPLRDRITALCCHGGLTGVPQVNIPAAFVYGAPVGLSIIAARDSDAALIAMARAIA